MADGEELGRGRGDVKGEEVDGEEGEDNLDEWAEELSRAPLYMLLLRWEKNSVIRFTRRNSR